jgi:RNA polymerase sigma-70 factor (ECF subfamily)
MSSEITFPSTTFRNFLAGSREPCSEDMGQTAPEDDSNTSDDDLLALMLAGDEEAFAALYRRRHEKVYCFALHMCGSPAFAEDVTQEVFLMLINHGITFDPARGSLSAFLMGVARNLVLRRLRRERLYVSIDANSETEHTLNGATWLSTEQIDDLSRSETIESVRKAVLSLPERYREVVVLCELQEMSYAETAMILGCAIGTVRSRLHRGRALLIEKLRPAREENKPAPTAKSARCLA